MENTPVNSYSPESPHRGSATIYLAYLAIGGILGDIGTSPLYVMSLTFKVLPINRTNVMGVLSLIVWSFVFLSTKYAWMALNLDNNGEGGTFALLSLIRKEGARQSTDKKRMLVGIAGLLSMACGALLLSDGVITPSISVLAAVEGIEVVYPDLHDFVIPTATIILIALFAIQKRGTEKIARVFSPVMIIWFLSIAFAGFSSLKDNFSLLTAFNPYYAILFLGRHPIAVVFPILGYIVLCITGGEALYADEAHYSKTAIRLAWAFASLCLLLNYFGQGSYLLVTHTVGNPFFALTLKIGHLFYIYSLIIATMAAIIASQAMITGSFSTYKQAMELGMLPRLEVRNTSSRMRGQIYISSVNRGMFVSCLATVFIFRGSNALGNAYGLAVTGAFIGTTLMMGIILYLRLQDRPSHFLSLLPLLLLFALFDLVFFSSNLGKIPTGGWFPLLIGSLLIVTMISWEKGSMAMYRAIPKETISSFIQEVQTTDIMLVPGTNIYMTANEEMIPAQLLEEFRLGLLHQNIVLVTVKNTDAPWGIQYEKKLIAQSQHGRSNKIYQVIIEKGYMRLFINVPNILNELGLSIEPRRFVIGMWNPIVCERGVRRWILSYFRIIYKNTPTLTQRFLIPAQEVAYIGGDLRLSFSGQLPAEPI